jgi:magnesium-transporting ATPase (P-type)
VSQPDDDDDDDEEDGFLAFLDPPKETAGPAIAALRDQTATPLYS